MRALCWHGHGDVRIDTVPDPALEAPTDVIIKITSTAICGSDLHLLDGYMPTMKSGDILGHEPMGIVVEVGSAVTRVKKGDRVVVPFTIACGSCFFCKKGTLCFFFKYIPQTVRPSMRNRKGCHSKIFGFKESAGFDLMNI